MAVRTWVRENALPILSFLIGLMVSAAYDFTDKQRLFAISGALVLAAGAFYSFVSPAKGSR